MNNKAPTLQIGQLIMFEDKPGELFEGKVIGAPINGNFFKTRWIVEIYPGTKPLGIVWNPVQKIFHTEEKSTD